MWGIVQQFLPFVLNKFTGCLVEIGAGSSTHVLNNIAKHYRLKFYSCDARKKANCTDKLSEYHYPMIMTSFEFMEIFDDEPIFVLLDGCHDYEVVKEEFYFFYKLLKPGGMILIHDTMPKAETHLAHGACSDSYKLRQELERNPEVNIITWPHLVIAHGLSMILKNHYYNDFCPPGEKLEQN